MSVNWYTRFSDLITALHASVSIILQRLNVCDPCTRTVLRYLAMLVPRDLRPAGDAAAMAYCPLPMLLLRLRCLPRLRERERAILFYCITFA